MRKKPIDRARDKLEVDRALLMEAVDFYLLTSETDLA